MSDAIVVKGLNKHFGKKYVLKNIHTTIAKGTMTALIGASGSGKSTLMRHMVGLATANDKQGGTIRLLDQLVQENGRLDGNVRRLRANVGYIFQQFNLVGRLSVLKNVLIGRLGRMPRWRGTLGIFTKEEKQLALRALERVGLLEFAYNRASTLSGGQQQRVAIARALCQEADIILADEPIASLDPESARRVMSTLESINKEDGKTVIVTLHQVDYAVKYCPEAIALKNGEIIFQGSSQQLSNDFLIELYGAEAGTALLFGSSSEESSAEDSSCRSIHHLSPHFKLA